MFRFAVYKVAARNVQLSMLPKQFLTVAAISNPRKMRICNKSLEPSPLPVFSAQPLFREFVPPTTGSLRAAAFSTDKDDKSSPPVYAAQRVTQSSASSAYMGSDTKAPTLPECDSSVAARGEDKSDYKIEISKNPSKTTSGGGSGGGGGGGGGGGAGSGSGGGSAGSTGSGGGDGGTVATEPQLQLPSKEQVEKYFFRVVAFVYDLTYLTLNWTVKNLDEHVLKNEKVQVYWKKFHEKMQQAKRDD